MSNLKVLRTASYFSLFLFIISIISCQKNSDTDPKTTKLLLKNNITLPLKEHGMLSFANESQFHEYLDYLDAIVLDEPQSENEEDNDETEIDDKLLAVEQSLDFNSLRAKLHKEFVNLDLVGFETLEDIPEEHYIASSAYKSVFNEHQEVKIGNSILVYYNSKNIVEITDGSIDTRNEIRTSRDISPNTIPITLSIKSNILVKPLSGNSSYTGSSSGSGLPKCNFGLRYLQPIEDETRYDPCFPTSRYIHISSGILCNSTNNIPWQGALQVTIDWGDGTSQTEVVNNGLARNDPNNISIQHNYSSIGFYEIRVSGVRMFNNTALSTNPGGIDLDILGSCFPDELRSNRIWRSSGNRAFSSQLQKNNLITLTHWGRARVCATTKSYRLKNGKWNSKRADRLHSSFSADHRGSATDCNIYRSQTKARWPRNSSKAEAVGSEKYKYTSNGDIHSDHRMKHNGTWHYNSLAVNPPGC